MNILDQLNRPVVLKELPRRIISLVPSQTELLHDIGLEEEVVGITKFCVHPSHWLKSKTIIGGTKQHHFDKIEALKPDLIIANKEENTNENVERLAALYPTYISDVHDIPSALTMIETVGKLCNRETKALALSHSITDKLQNYLPSTDSYPYSVLYLIWQNPLMAAGSDTFISAMLDAAGFKNVLKEKRYPILSEERIAELEPDYIFFSSEPYPFTEKHFDEYFDAFPTSEKVLVDGEMFSWYGSRLLKAVDYWSRLTIM